MAMRKYVEVNISAKSKTTIKYVMKMLASVAEAVIFMFLGVSAVSSAHVWNTEFVLLTVFFCLMYRVIGTAILAFFFDLYVCQRVEPKTVANWVSAPVHPLIIPICTIF